MGGGELGWGMVGKNNNTDTEDNTGSSLRGLDVHSLRAGWGGPSPSSAPELLTSANSSHHPADRQETKERNEGQAAAALLGPPGARAPPPGSCNSQHS